MLSFLLWLLLFLPPAHPKHYDLVYRNAAYTSYFSTKRRVPVLVTYTLWRGGGDCSRAGMYFSGDPNTATQADYAATGFDIGHLANAEDFAYDCATERLTFRYYNALPQTPNLNRGVWKIDETKIRALSQSDSLLVLCGGIFPKPTRYIGKQRVFVPTYCYKVVQSLSTKQVLISRIYTNTDRAMVNSISVADLEKILGYKLPLRP